MEALAEFGEDMALRIEDKEWINGRIDDAIRSLLPRGWRRIAHWLREWGLAGTVVMAFLALLGSLIAVSIFAANGITKNAEFRTHTEDRLTRIEEDVKSIHIALDALRLTQLSLNPANPQNAQQAKSLLADAQAKHVKLDTSVIEDSGKRFIDAAQNPASWSAANQFVSYRSFLNKDFQPNLSDLRLTPVEPGFLT